MEEVTYRSLEIWGWECSECGHWHEISEDPGYIRTLICEGCGVEFIPIPE